MSGRRLTARALLVASAIVIGLQAPQPLRAQSNNNATFTAAQASAGANAYSQNCASCHGSNTDDGEFAPSLKGTAFIQKYAGKPVGELIDYMTSRMPPGNPGGVTTLRRSDRWTHEKDRPGKMLVKRCGPIPC